MLQDTNMDSAKENDSRLPLVAKIGTVAYNVIGIAVGVIGLFWDSKISSLFILIYPLVGIALVFLSKGAIKLISDDKNRLNGSINLGFIISIIFMAFKSIDAYNLFQSDNFWLPFSIIIVIIILLFYLIDINPIDERRRVDAVILFMVGVLYSYGATKEINCGFDISSPHIYNAVILGKREYHGRHNSYYFTLSPWGALYTANEVEDNSGIYDRVKIGDTVKVNFKQGLFNIPWFIVTK
jgi:hypothetical protein